jgi:hypothetical protein
MFRHSGDSFKLRVYDVHGVNVAEFDVPSPNPPGLPVWEPDELPTKKPAGDIEITLKRISVQPVTVNEGGREVTHFALAPDISVARDGRPAPEFSIQQFELEDVFGNVSSVWDVHGLSPHERAWKMKVSAWPGKEAALDPSREWHPAPLSLPPSRNAILVHQARTLAGVHIELVAVGGADEVEYTDTVKSGSDSMYASAGRFAESQFRVEGRRTGATETIVVRCPWPHLLLHTLGRRPDHQFQVTIRDDRGRDVPLQLVDFVSDRSVVMLQPATDARSVEATFKVEEARTAEFFVSPPGSPNRD